MGQGPAQGWTYRDSEPVPPQWRDLKPNQKSWRERVVFWHFRYLVATSTFMLEPWERRLFDSFVLGFLFMTTYACYLYLPAYGVRFLESFAFAFWQVFDGKASAASSSAVKA